MKKFLMPLKRIAAIHDISGLGKCSLTVALPIVSASGVECACIPTALLSTHTGEFKNWTLRDLTSEMLPIAEHWHSLNVSLDGVYSGYLASPEQAELMSRVLELIAGENTLVIVDPAMADNGEYYANLDERMCRAFKSLCMKADVITPNVTEAALLCGLPCEKAPHSREYIDRLLKGLAELGPSVIAITGVHLTEHEIGYVVLECESGEEYVAMRQAYDGVFYGTGDIFSSAFAALLVRGARVKDALEAASFLVGESVEISYRRKTPRRYGVAFEAVLPEYINRVSAMFGQEPSV